MDLEIYPDLTNIMEFTLRLGMPAEVLIDQQTTYPILVINLFDGIKIIFQQVFPVNDDQIMDAMRQHEIGDEMEQFG